MNEVLQLRGDVQIQAAGGNGKPPRAAIVAYTGGEFSPNGWPHTVIDLSGADIAGEIPLLAGHQDDLDSIAGQGRAAIRDGKLLVDGHITDATAAGQKILALSRSGISLQASVGFEPEQREHIAAGQTININNRTLKAGEHGLTVIRSGKLREVSLLSIGADPNTQVSISAKRGNNLKGTQKMATDNANTQHTDELKASWDQPGMNDADRVFARWNNAKFVDENIRAEGEQFLKAGLSGQLKFNDFEREILKLENRDLHIQAIRAARPTAPAVLGAPHSRTDNSKNILAASAMAHFGRESLGEKVYGADTMQYARDLALRSVHDMARFALREKGIDSPSSGEQMLQAAFSTTDLPYALADSAGKIALNQFNELSVTWRSWCDVVSVADFKAKSLIRLGHTSGLAELPPDGEIGHAVMDETVASVTAKTYAKMLAVSRTHLVNDDLSLIPQVAGDFGRLAARKVSNLVYVALLRNSGSFFAESAGNYITDALDADGLSAGLLALRNQEDGDGEPIDIPPRTLLVPPTLESTARQLLNSEQLLRYVASGVDNKPSGNPYKNLNLTLEVEPRMENDGYTNYSTTAWYLMGPPSAQVAVVAFLDGKQGPVVETQQTDFNTLGQQWRCYIDVGVALCEPKAGVMSTGAG